MLDFKKIENICAIVFIVAFFMPWVSYDTGFGTIQATGASIPGTMNNLGSLAGESAPWYVYLVYLVPLTAIGVLVTDFLKADEKIARIVTIVAGVLPLAGMIYVLIEAGSVAFSFLGIGMYLTLLAAIAMLLAVFGVIKIPK